MPIYFAYFELVTTYSFFSAAARDLTIQICLLRLFVMLPSTLRIVKLILRFDHRQMRQALGQYRA
jgi:hypothetical protein